MNKVHKHFVISRCVFVGVDMELILILIPLVVTGLFWTSNDKKILNLINAIGSGVLLLYSVFIAFLVLRNGFISSSLLNNIFYIDSLSALILVITTFVSFMVSLFSIGYNGEEIRRKHMHEKTLKIYYSLFHVFVFTMLLTITAQNLGVMWIAVEGTTLASAFLVGFYNNKKSIEAAWKYIIICSVGIAFALLGIIMLYYSSVQSFGHTAQSINWRFLFENSKSLQGSILKLSFIFTLIGFGTKVGLAPMHTWLPDAHSQAPSPISALLSGVLLNTAMYGIIRVMIIVNKNLGSNLFTGRLLMILGIFSIGTAAMFIMVQNDFKRLLAYSSIEHMGIIALGLGILSPLSVFAAVFHIVNHALTKSMLFMSTGNIYLKYDTKKINKVKGIMTVTPITGLVFILGIFAITGMPPFSIFSSEINIIISSFKGEHYLSAALLLGFLILIFAGFVTQLIRMFFGKPINKEIQPGEISKIGSAVLLSMLVIVLITGIYLPGPLKSLIDGASEIILGGAKL